MVLQSFCPGNTVPFLDQEQNKSSKNAQNNANKWHLPATLAAFFENDTFSNHSKTDRNKVKHFGGPSPDPVETVLVIGLNFHIHILFLHSFLDAPR